jgi:hypothetical protein
MKALLITLLVLTVLFAAAQVFMAQSTGKTEGHAYVVLKTFTEFEIRRYQPALFSYVVMQSAEYKEVSSKGFRTLAGYIFGGNDKKQQISMTSPVTMTMADSITMKFKIPEGMELEAMPKPNNPNVRFASEPEKTVAAITFDGWATDQRIAEYTQKLKDLLVKNNISHTGKFSYLGYNPPYEVLNRRNEIVVDVEF